MARPRARGRCRRRPSRTGTAAAWPASTVASVSCRADGLTGLTRNAATTSLGRSWTPSDDRITTGVAAPARGAAQRRRQRDAIELGHVQVEDGEIERLSAGHPVEGLARRRGVVAVMPQRPTSVLDDAPVGGVVVDDEDAPAGEVDADQRSTGDGGRAAAAWMVRRKVLPAPATPRLSASSEPSMSSASRRLMASPDRSRRSVARSTRRPG